MNTCNQCSLSFQGKKDARYCSNKCRLQAHRAKSVSKSVSSETDNETDSETDKSKEMKQLAQELGVTTADKVKPIVAKDWKPSKGIAGGIVTGPPNVCSPNNDSSKEEKEQFCKILDNYIG